ncbi:MAG: PEP-CTERM sorting domain-containing protein [Chitinivorax sp.]
MNLKHNSIAAAAVLLACSASVNAANITNTLFSGFQQLSDNSAETIIKAQNSTSNPKLLEVGDRLHGIFTIETIEKSPNPKRLLGTGGNYDLSGIFDITVTGKNGGPGAYSFTFAPTASFQALYGSGAMIAFFEDPVNNYTRTTDATCTSSAAGGNCEQNITDGNLLWVAGFGTSLDFWQANSITDNIAQIGAIPAPNNGGTYNLGLSQLAGGTGPSLGLVNCFNLHTFTPTQNNICGSGSLLGTGGVNTPYTSFDNVDFTINVNKVPEPAILGLMGLGLIGMAAGRRKKVK